MSQLDQQVSVNNDKNMSTSKNNSTLRLNQEGLINQERDWRDHDNDSEISENDFLTKGAFLLTPSHELSMEKGATICDKMNFR